jgi:FMN phosphatase YigB (HAD superfamily)
VAHAVTIDFHDTLFQCDDWFELEVRELPLRYLGWRASQVDGRQSDFEADDVARRYRQLRRRAIDSGVEVDAVDCVVRVCGEIGVEVDRADVERGVAVLMREVLPTACPRPGAVELVRLLRASGVKLGIISNAIYHPYLEWSLQAHALLDQFELILSSAMAGFYKSRVELYQIAATALGVQPERIVHIGDSYLFDVVGASRAGMRTVWLNLNGADATDVAPDLEVRSLEGLAPLLIETFKLTPAAAESGRAL